MAVRNPLRTRIKTSIRRRASEKLTKQLSNIEAAVLIETWRNRGPDGVTGFVPRSRKSIGGVSGEYLSDAIAGLRRKGFLASTKSIQGVPVYYVTDKGIRAVRAERERIRRFEESLPNRRPSA